jgi:hypothetical protein
MNKIIKTLIISLLLVTTSIIAQVAEQRTVSNSGQHLIRFYNNTNYYVSCYYKSNYGFYTFSLAPRKVSIWFPFYAPYRWECKR